MLFSSRTIDTHIQRNTGGNDYFKTWEGWISAILDELDNHSSGVGGVITNIGSTLKDITGEDAVSTYITDFCTNQMEGVQTFLREQQAKYTPAQASPTCNYNSVDQYSVQDVGNVHDILYHLGYGDNNNNCQTGAQGGCVQVAISGSVAVQMCGPPNSNVQYAACANLAIALNTLKVDCAKDYMVGGAVGIPYLDGVTLELEPSQVDT